MKIAVPWPPRPSWARFGCFVSLKRSLPVSILRPAPRFAAFLTILLIGCLPCRGRAEEYSSPSDGIHRMHYEEGLVSLEAQDATLEKVLTELSKMAQVKIVADGPIEGRITQYLNRVPLDKALRKILRDKDMGLIYTARAGTKPVHHAVTEVRIYVAEEGTGGGRLAPLRRVPGRTAAGRLARATLRNEACKKGRRSHSSRRHRAPQERPQPPAAGNHAPTPLNISHNIDAERLPS